MDIGEAQKQHDEAPHQHVCAKRNPGLAPIRLPIPLAEIFKANVADVRKLVGEKQNGDPGNAKRQPCDFGVVRVKEDAVLLHPQPEKVADTGRRCHQSGKQKDVA